MGHEQNAHSVQCCCCARANAAPEPEPFHFTDVPLKQWIAGAIMFTIIGVTIFIRHG
ncbi:hypothetical protein [Streptomyces sp. NE06-03C]|uniref:hypothetical protein n=1 Tax=Streptomyces sp. NE06-03C TaxID=3028694 RepID=UPI0029A6368E|nr:hypothetical protein [Streptomyces sp. NE06-03C]MDX2922477.1 hypothetical protein [Streptomyces sp. NE06-03C]